MAIRRRQRGSRLRMASVSIPLILVEKQARNQPDFWFSIA
jgi:hypothetical protein